MPFSWFCQVTLAPALCRHHHMGVQSTIAHGTPSNLWRYLRKKHWPRMASLTNCSPIKREAWNSKNNKQYYSPIYQELNDQRPLNTEWWLSVTVLCSAPSALTGVPNCGGGGCSWLRLSLACWEAEPADGQATGQIPDIIVTIVAEPGLALWRQLTTGRTKSSPVTYR